MLISTTKLKEMDKFKDIDENTLKEKICAIEIAIRSHTHNNFQNRMMRIKASSTNEYINGTSPFFKVGDTIEISQSVNAGLYTIKEIAEDKIYFNEPIYATDINVVTKIEYPKDIIQGALSLLEWEVDPDSGKNKVGIASESETLSRHSQSITYKNYDGSNTIKGYPAELMSFCSPYISMRY